MANRKLGKVGNLVNLGKVIPSFRFCPTAKIENSDLKILEKNFRGFRVFDLAIGFFINTAPRNISFILHYDLFFRKEYLYFS